MTIRIRTKGIRLWLPVPLSLAGWAVRLVPGSVFAELQAGVPEPYRCLLTKPAACALVRESLAMLKEYKGLTLVDVATKDGDLVSITL